MTTAKKYWVIRISNGACVFGILAINEQHAWEDLCRILNAIDGKGITPDTVKKWNAYKAEEIEIPDSTWAE